MMEVKRGQVYLATLQYNDGSVQKGLRPVVVIQNNMGNKYSPTVIICTLTTKVGKRNLPTHVTLNESDGVKLTSDVQTEQIMTINKTQLSDFCLCELDENVMKKIDAALLVSLGIVQENQEKTQSAIIQLKDIIANKKAKLSEIKSILYTLEENEGTNVRIV